MFCIVYKYSSLSSFLFNLILRFFYRLFHVFIGKCLLNPFQGLFSSVLFNRQRIPPKNVYYYRCPDHRKNYVMSFAFCFDKDSDTYQFAYCYPYTYARLQGYLDVLEKRRLNYMKRELLCLSVVRYIFHVKKLIKHGLHTQIKMQNMI